MYLITAGQCGVRIDFNTIFDDAAYKTEKKENNHYIRY